MSLPIHPYFFIDNDDDEDEHVLKNIKESDIATSAPEEPIPDTVKSKELKKEIDLTDWRSWRHNKDGDCPCGIKKEMCEFHK